MSSYLTAFESGMLNKPRIAYGPAEHDRTPEQDAALTAEREEETRQRYIAADQAAAYRTYAPNILFSGVRAGEQISTPYSRYKLMVARNLEPPTEWVRCINDVLVPVGTWHDGITRIAEFERRHPEYAAWLEPVLTEVISRD